MNEIDLLARLGGEVPPMPDRAREDARLALMERAGAERAGPAAVPAGSAEGGPVRPLAWIQRGHARGPGRARGRRRPLRMGAAAALAAAAAVTAAVAVPWGQDTPAYAVEKRPDGSVEIRIREFLEPRRLQASLREAGIPAVVDYLPDGQVCRRPRGAAVPPHEAPRLVREPLAKDEPGTLLRIAPGRLAPGQSLIITAGFDRNDPSRAAGVAMQVVRGPVRDCDPRPIDGPDRVPLPDEGGSPAVPARPGGTGAP
ncbi:hypothetical protein ACFY4C_31285 [Actinomadura viridis]|uniref:hypothetical protein n=1 Tax=Actinomadura viridis TaxID=58110 RepID=UPI00369B12ED